MIAHRDMAKRVSRPDPINDVLQLGRGQSRLADHRSVGKRQTVQLGCLIRIQHPVFLRQINPVAFFQVLRRRRQTRIHAEQLQAAFEMWQKAKAGLEIAEKSYNRVNRLFEQGVMTAQKRDEAKAQYDAMAATERAAHAQYTMAKNGAQREDKAMAAAQVERAKGAVAEVASYIAETYLLASADGEVTEVFPKEGELVGTGAPIMNIARLNEMWVTFNVREDFLKQFSVGGEIKAYIPALEKEATFKVTYMKDLGTYAAWKATKTTGQYDLKTFEVKAKPVQAVENLRPGMSAICTINK